MNTLVSAAGKTLFEDERSQSNFAPGVHGAAHMCIGNSSLEMMLQTIVVHQTAFNHAL